MARGIDAIGHQGAMDAHGRAIGMLGTGIDVYYPKGNKKLYEKVLERAAIISEFSLRTHPAPENFPVRNCIVSGMPLGVVVVEGAQYSGSLITAAGHGVRAGSLRRAGKRHTAREFRAEPTRPAGRQTRYRRRGRDRRAAAALEGEGKKIYELLSAEQPVHIDDIVERSGLNSSEVLATLFDLEMKGIVRQLPGKQFSKVLL